MTSLRAAFVAAVLCLSVAPAVASASQGEPAKVLAGAAWAPASGFRAVAAAGDFVVSGSDDGHLRVFDRDGREVRRLDLGDPVTRVVASADGSTVAASTSTGELVVVEPASGHEPARAHAANLLALSPDGKKVVYANEDGAPELFVGREVTALGTERATAAAFSPDGSRLALALDDGDLRVDAPARTMRIGRGVTALAFVMDDRLAFGTSKGEIALVDLGAKKKTKLVATPTAVTGLALTIDGLAVSLANDGAELVALDGSVVRRFTTDAPCCASLALAEAGRTLVAAGATRLERWNLASGAALFPFVGQPDDRAIALAPDGSFALVDGSAIDLATGAISELAKDATAAAISHDGKLAALGDGNGEVDVVDVATKKRVHELEAADAATVALAFSSDGAKVAVASDDGRVQLVDVASGDAKTVTPFSASPRAIAFSPDGTMLASAGAAGVRLWSVASSSELRRVPLDGANGVAWSSDGKRLVVPAADGTARVLDATTGAELKRVSVPAPATSALFVGTSLVVAGADALHVFDNGKPTATLALRARALALGKNATLLAAATTDGGVTLVSFPDRAITGELHVGALGSVVRLGDQVFRDGDGRLVRVKSDDAGGLKSSPPEDASTALLKLELAGSMPVSIDQPGRATLSLHATGVDARWLTVRATKLPPSFALLAPPAIRTLAAGADAKVDVGFALVSNGASVPTEATVTLEVDSAAGAGPTVDVPLHVRAAKVALSLVAVDGAFKAPVAKVEVANVGDEATGPLALVPRFLENGEPAGSAPTQELSDLAPGERIVVGLAAPAKLVAERADLELTARATKSGATWSLRAPMHRQVAWPIPVGVAAALVVLVGLFVLWRVTRNPIVQQVARDPNELRRYALAQLPLVERALTRARRLDSALAGAKLPELRFARAVQAGTSAEGAARSFAEALGAKLGGKIESHDAWSLELPAMTLRFPQRTAVAIFAGAAVDSGPATLVATSIFAGGHGPTVALALDLSAAQNGRVALAQVGRLSFVVLGRDEVRDLLYADQPSEPLQLAVAAQRPVAELAPYVTSGGVEDESLFVGREKELRAIADRTLHNCIVVAPRQMGKSSLLKAVNRRLSARADLEVHHLTLFEDDLAQRMARELDVAKPEDVEGFLKLAAGSRRKPKVWLFDEADSFILKDSKNKYPLAQAMRTLSEEGRAYFVLAGFWHLYAAAFLNPNNPLRNFGELVRLEPIDRDAARELATRPMTALGLGYESPSLVERILDETACRAHLVATVCKALIDALAPTERTFRASHVDAALLRNPALADEFKHWRREALSRAIVRAALMGAPANRGELRVRLSMAGLNPSTELYAATLDKLELGYTLVPDAEGRLTCPVPLLQRFIEQEEDLAHGLARDAADFKAASGA